MIGGEYVPFGQLWRTGANEPTVVFTTAPTSIARPCDALRLHATAITVLPNTAARTAISVCRDKPSAR